MEEIRRHADLYRGMVEDWRRGQQTAMPVIFGAEEPVPDPILQSLADKLGLLDDDVAADIAAFVNVKLGLEIDLRSIAKGAFSQLGLADRIRVVEQDLALWDKWLKQGDDLLDRLESRRPWWRRFLSVFS
jgi:hypothetical protein